MKILYVASAIIFILLLIKCIKSIFLHLHTGAIISKARANAAVPAFARDATQLTFNAEKSACVAQCRAEPCAKNMHFLDFIYIAGTRYHNVACANAQKRGRLLQAVREPYNPHDCNAIALCAENGTKIGYVPRKFNTIPCSMIDAGCNILVKINSVYTSPEAPIIRASIYIESAPHYISNSPDDNRSYSSSNLYLGSKSTYSNLKIDRDMLQSIIDDKKQELCPKKLKFNSLRFIDLILLQSAEITDDCTIPLFNSDHSPHSTISICCIPQNQQTAIKSLLQMRHKICAVINGDLSIEGSGIIITELYASI